MRRTVRIVRIGIAAATFRGLVIGSVAGFILGVAGALWWAMLASVLTAATGYDMTGVGYVMLALLPIGGMTALGGAGMVATFLATLLYNLTAGVFGGVPVEVEENDTEPSIPLTAAAPAIRQSRRLFSHGRIPSSRRQT